MGAVLQTVFEKPNRVSAVSGQAAPNSGNQSCEKSVSCAAPPGNKPLSGKHADLWLRLMTKSSNSLYVEHWVVCCTQEGGGGQGGGGGHGPGGGWIFSTTVCRILLRVCTSIRVAASRQYFRTAAHISFRFCAGKNYVKDVLKVRNKLELPATTVKLPSRR